MKYLEIGDKVDQKFYVLAISAEIKNYYNQVFKFVLEDYQSNVIYEKLSAVI